MKSTWVLGSEIYDLFPPTSGTFLRGEEKKQIFESRVIKFFIFEKKRI